MSKRTLITAGVGATIRATPMTPSRRQDELVGVRFVAAIEAGTPTAQIGQKLHVPGAAGCSTDITPPPNQEARGRHDAPS